MRAKKNKARLSLKPHSQALLFFLFIMTILCGFWIQETRTSPHVAIEESGSVRLFANQTNDDLTKEIAAAIGNAKESVRLIVYTLTDQTIIKALRKKSSEGVPVSVIYDAAASPNVNARLGSRVATIRCIGPGRMHQKILVIDGKSTWIGSANMTPESLRIHGNLITAIDHPALAQHILAKSETATIEGFEDSFPHMEFNAGGQQMEMSFLPDDGAAVSRLKELISTAKKTVRVAMFTWTRQDLAQAVAEASQRGVDVEVVIDSYQGKGSSAKIVKMLKEKGIRVALSPAGSLLHHKFLYIDKTTLVNGSANWTNAAFTQNDDCFIIMHGLTPRQREQMEALWNVIRAEASAVEAK